MTYRHYIMKNRIKDSKEAYADYQSKYNTQWVAMSEPLREQHISVTYKYRFAIQYN